MTERMKRHTQKDGRWLYQQDRARLMADPKMKKLYDEEAAKKATALQLTEARQAVGLTQEEVAARLGISQSQISRWEKQGEDLSVTALRRYVSALGEDLTLEVKISRPHTRQRPGRITAST